MMKRAQLILAGLMISLVAVTACAPEPPIPHSIEGRADCISCHGQNGVKPYPQWHAKRDFGNNKCTNCHQLKLDTSR